MVSPGADSVDWLNHAQMGHVAGASGQKVLTCGVASSGRMRRQGESAGKTRLQKSFDAVQMFQY